MRYPNEPITIPEESFSKIDVDRYDAKNITEAIASASIISIVNFNSYVGNSSSYVRNTLDQSTSTIIIS